MCKISTCIKITKSSTVSGNISLYNRERKRNKTYLTVYFSVYIYIYIKLQLEVKTLPRQLLLSEII